MTDRELLENIFSAQVLILAEIAQRRRNGPKFKLSPDDFILDAVNLISAKRQEVRRAMDTLEIPF